jgi:hypothetical protein
VTKKKRKSVTPERGLAMAAVVIGCDGNFNVSTFFELHFIATLVS